MLAAGQEGVTVHSAETCEEANLGHAVRTLLDKQDIYELLARYLRAADRGDVEGLRVCYLPGAREEHGGVFDGSAEDYVHGIAAALSHPRRLTSHAMTNVLIEVDGDRARAESYVTVFARVRTADGKGDSVTGLRIIDNLEKVDGRWGIRLRRLRWDWNHDMPVAESWIHGNLVSKGNTLIKSEPYPADVIYEDWR
ncbi:nuclear transport factor 2 family protein [Streptosporangium sp. NPDC087985]|uniref:nuclear transport factor 2 family protein n=1 Tax=Streptosporangium sp. NPDC087985 TaxID=3366196 RepID=UPI00382FD256